MVFVAEIGSNHMASKSLAYEMVRQSALAGANIAKFQLGHWRPKEACPETAPQWLRYAPMAWAQDIATWCDDFGILFMASIFSMDGLRMARSVGMKAYKMASPKAFAEHGKGSQDTILKAMLNDGVPIYATNRVSPVHKSLHPIFAVTNYPTYPKDVEFPEFGKTWFGYSSHVHGIADALIAISRGAKYIEKHLTLNRTELSIKDNHFALTPDDFKQMVVIGQQIARLIDA